MATVDVRRANERFHSELDWLDSWHSFSFSSHYDPKNTHHGLLLVHNDDVVAPGTGFGTHAHQDMEIVTWVLDGALEHRDSEGNHGVIRPGLAQRMSAGRGIRHSEQNASSDEPVHLLQMWVIPDVRGIAPEYEEVDVSDRLQDDALFPLASGREDDAAIKIHQRDATLWVGRLRAGRDRHRSRTRRSCTCSSHGDRSRSTASVRSTPATRCASPTRVRGSSPPGPTAPRSPCGRPTPICYLTNLERRRSARTLPPV